MASTTTKVKTNKEKLRQAYKRERYKRSCAYFIRDAVYIEDKTNKEGMSKFALWPKQLEVLNSFLTLQFLIVLKARQLGLTWLSLAYALHKMLFEKGYTVLFISKRDIPDCKIATLRMKRMLRRLPSWLIVEKKKAPAGWDGLMWEASTHEITIHRPDGEESQFIALAASPDTAHSFTANLIILDEWALHPFADEIWTGAYPTVNRADFSGQVIGLSTGRINTLFEDIWKSAKLAENMFTPIFLNWKADPRRDKAWYERTKANLPKTYRSQYPSVEADAFTIGEGAFFEEWDEEIHVFGNWIPPKHWLRYASYDPGYSTRACWKWYAMHPSMEWGLCYREYYPHRVTDKDQALEIVRMSKNADGTQEHLVWSVADTDAWTPSRDSGKSTADRFDEVFEKYFINPDGTLAEEGEQATGALPLTECGYSLTKASKNLENGWRELHEWLKPYDGPDGEQMSKLRFTDNCLNSRRCYPAAETSETNPNDIAKKSEHHVCDVDRYFVVELLIEKPEEKEEGPPPGSSGYMREIRKKNKKLAKQYSTKKKRENLSYMVEVKENQDKE